MKLDFTNERILAIVAHPDDAELLCAGTLARAKTDGSAIGICVLCQGDKGQPSRPIRNLAAVRRKEMAAATKLLGADLLMGGFFDGELFDTKESRLRSIELVRQFRPTLLLAHAPEDYHPDHKAASALTEASSWFAASRGHKTKSKPLSAAPALWFMDTVNMQGFTPDFYVDVSAQLALKERMLACHRSQLACGKDGDFSPLLDLLRRQSLARGAQSGVAAAEAFRIHDAFKRASAW
jgi:N-acetylglucosamine malate deacetylase 1